MPGNDDLERFVESLAIPAERKAVVLAELVDHVACAREAATRAGQDPEEAARTSLGDLETLRHSLEAVEPAFRTTRKAAMARALLASLLIAALVDRWGGALSGGLGALLAVAIAAAFAPRQGLALLRAELRAAPVPGTFGRAGLPVGPAVTYLYTVMGGPILVWIGLIFWRARAGELAFDTPPSAFAVMAAVYALLIVEGVRARRRAAG